MKERSLYTIIRNSIYVDVSSLSTEDFYQPIRALPFALSNYGLSIPNLTANDIGSIMCWMIVEETRAVWRRRNFDKETCIKLLVQFTTCLALAKFD